MPANENSLPPTMSETSPSAGAQIRAPLADSASASDRTIREHEDGAAKVERVNSRAAGRPGGPFQGLWLWESLALLLSIGCMLAIVVISIKVNNTSLSDWTLPVGISTLFSLLSTVSKAACMLPIAECISQFKWQHLAERERPLSTLVDFDDASKGPWGSLLFLNPAKITSRPLFASLGALLTVVALAMGPFPQQAVVLTREAVQQNARSFIPVASSFNTGRIDKTMEGGLTFPTMLDPKLQSAFFNGVFDNGDSFPYNCPSGNCTWDDFTSLGLCSTCEDVSSKTQVSVSYGETTGPPNPQNLTVTWLNVTFTAPDGNSLPLPYTHTNKRASWKAPQVVAGADVDFHHSGVCRPQHNLDMNNLWNTSATEKLAFVGVLQQSGNSTDMETIIANKKWVGNWTYTQCVISWCAKRYRNVQIVNGTVKPYNVMEIPLKPGPVSQILEGDSEKRLIWPLVPREAEDIGSATPSSASPPSRDSVAVTNVDHLVLSSYICSTFGSWQSLIGFKFAPDNNVSAVLQNTTESLTNALRSGWGDHQAEGVTWSQDVTIHIAWVWLALPLAVVFLTAVLLGATVAVNALHRWQPLWKSSLWPLVFHGVEWSAEEKRARDDGSLREVEDMKEAAKTIRITVQYNGVGTRTIQRL